MLKIMIRLPDGKEFDSPRAAQSKSRRAADKELVARSLASLERSYALLRREQAKSLPRVVRYYRSGICRAFAKECREIAQLPDTAPRIASTLKALANNLISIAGQVERLELAIREEQNQPDRQSSAGGHPE